MQKGYIYQTNGAWHVRYRADGKQVSRKLADYNDQYRRSVVSVHWPMKVLTR
jgi:hypothetical protein